jgi:hypothetical protein
MLSDSNKKEAMKILSSKKYGDGTELWFGVPSWDPAGRSGEMSVKFAYPTANKQRWARTSPEVPEAVVWDMLVMLNEKGRLFETIKRLNHRSDALKGTISKDLESVISTLQKVKKSL